MVTLGCQTYTLESPAEHFRSPALLLTNDFRSSREDLRTCSSTDEVFVVSLEAPGYLEACHSGGSGGDPALASSPEDALRRHEDSMLCQEMIAKLHTHPIPIFLYIILH